VLTTTTGQGCAAVQGLQHTTPKSLITANIAHEDCMLRLQLQSRDVLQRKEYCHIQMTKDAVKEC